MGEAPEATITALRKPAYRSLYCKPARLWKTFRLIPNKASMLPYLAVLFAQRAFSR